MNVGDIIGSYRVLEKLGEGGMGEVYKARDEKLDRFVALKVLHTARATDPGFRDRFQREARAVAALTHPNIVTVHSIEEHDGSPFLTMELVEGKTLAEMIPPGGASVAQFLHIAIPLADAVGAAHARGITHRDLKPVNVMITTDGRLKVLDFGLAKLAETSAGPSGFSAMPTEHLTGHGQILGTVAYMSPEQAEGKPVDHRSDIFSLGIILYELVTGRKPFTGDTSMSLLSSILRDTPTPVSEVNTAIPREIARLIRRCLEKNPAQRLQSALDLKHELEDLRAEGSAVIAVPAQAKPEGLSPQPHEGGIDDKPKGLSPQLSGWSKSATGSGTSQISIVLPAPSRMLIWIGIAVALVVVSGAAYWIWPRGGSPTTATATTSVSDSKTLTITRFENRTGDASLDPLGQLVADTILQELPQLGFPRATGAAGPRRSAVVSGAYYLDGQNLRIQASLSDPSGTVLYAIEPALAPSAERGKAVDLAQQRMLGAIITFLDPKSLVRSSSRPPLYRAYREFSAGADLFADEPLKAIEHFKRAIDLDPDFFGARNFMATAYANLGDRTHQRETLEQMSARRDRWTEFDRLMLSWSIHASEGRLLDALKALREAEKLDPEDLVVNYLTGFYELRLNRPQAAIDQYGKVNADILNASTPGGWRHTRLASANHLLGRHEEELRLATVAKGMFPSSLATRNDELFALAALGRMDDLRQAIDDTLSVTVLGGGTPGGSMRAAAEELRAHGHRAESIEWAKRSVAWYRNQPTQFLTLAANRLALAQALYAAEEWGEAGKLAAVLLKEQPDNTVYMTLAGAVAARLGDRGAASKHATALAQVPAAPFGAVELRRAQLAALLGGREQAVQFLRDAFSRGLPMSVALHRNIDLEPLRGFAPFDELMKPKG